MNTNFEVIIIGGSYAGLSAALTLGRSLRRVLVLDNARPCNRQTPHSQNFLTQDGATPQEISAIAKAQVLKYSSVVFKTDTVGSGRNLKDGFEITTQAGVAYTATKLIIASGVHDIMPDIKGFADCWGISVIHCPYCHGYEHKAVKTAIIANGDAAMHYVPLIKNLTAALSIVTNGKANFTPEQLTKLQAHNIPIIEHEISEIEHEKGYLKAIHFKDAPSADFSAAYASIPFKQNSSLHTDLNYELTEEHLINVSPFQETNRPGIYACGDATSRYRSVAFAVSTGQIAATKINFELVNADF